MRSLRLICSLVCAFVIACSVPSCRFGYELLGRGGVFNEGDTSATGGSGGAGPGPVPGPVAGGQGGAASPEPTVGGAGGEPYNGPIPDPDLAPVMSAGQRHSCAVSSSGDLYCWGSNDSDALGGHMDAENPNPGLVQGEGELGGFVGVVAGANSTCALRAVGTVWCWGDNSQGQLGQGDSVDRSIPTMVELAGPVRALSLNHRVTCAIEADGAIACWGKNDEGQAGQADTERDPLVANRPLRVPSAIPWAQVSAGDGHVCAIRADGALFCWGRNNVSQLGVPSPVQVRAPLRIGTANDWKNVQAAVSHTCGIKTNGALYCWGAGDRGQLGILPATQRTTPTRVGTDSDWVSIEPQVLHTCGLRGNGSIWCWGRREEGQLVVPYDPAPQLTPLQIDPELDWDLMTSGRFHTCGRRSDGQLRCTGENVDGRLGDGTFDRSYGFELVGPL